MYLGRRVYFTLKSQPEWLHTQVGKLHGKRILTMKLKHKH